MSSILYWWASCTLLFPTRSWLNMKAGCLLREAARVVTPHRELNITRDPADNRFLECAVKANYLVTGNKRHFPKQWRQTLVVNARELLEWIIPELRRGAEPTHRKVRDEFEHPAGHV